MNSLIASRQLPDFEIISSINNGDAALFEILVRRYNPYLYKVGRSYGFCHEDVEDLMQETFIHAFQNLGYLHNAHFFKTWLIRILLNECYRKNHKLAKRTEFSVDPLLKEKSILLFTNNGNDNSEKKLENKELGRVVESAIQHIPMDYRMVFSLRELNGLSVLETSKALDITETNVKVRLNRAKAMLKKEVEKMYSAEDIFEFHLTYCDRIVARVNERISR